MVSEQMQIRDSATAKATRFKTALAYALLHKKARHFSERWLAASTPFVIQSSSICENHLGVSWHAVCAYLGVALWTHMA